MDIQTSFPETHNPSARRLNTGDTVEPYHAFQCGVGRIIETDAVPDKQSSRTPAHSSLQKRRRSRTIFIFKAHIDAGSRSIARSPLSPFRLPCCLWMRPGRRQHIALDTTPGKSVPVRLSPLQPSPASVCSGNRRALPQAAKSQPVLPPGISCLHQVGDRAPAQVPFIAVDESAPPVRQGKHHGRGCSPSRGRSRPRLPSESHAQSRAPTPEGKASRN